MNTTKRWPRVSLSRIGAFFVSSLAITVRKNTNRPQWAMVFLFVALFKWGYLLWLTAWRHSRERTAAEAGDVRVRNGQFYLSVSADCNKTSWSSHIIVLKVEVVYWKMLSCRTDLNIQVRGCRDNSSCRSTHSRQCKWPWLKFNRSPLRTYVTCRQRQQWNGNILFDVIFWMTRISHSSRHRKGVRKACTDQCLIGHARVASWRLL